MRLVDEAERLGLELAVNQNGRWAPAWRAATLLIEQGAIGDVVAVTHLYHHNYAFTLGTVFDEIEHLVLYDYSVHWFDITRCWLEKRTPTAVRAREYRTPNQPVESKAPWGTWATIDYEDGSSAVIRGVGSRGDDEAAQALLDPRLGGNDPGSGARLRCRTGIGVARARARWSEHAVRARRLVAHERVRRLSR